MYLFAVDLSCLVQLFFFFFWLLLLWNKHWLFNSKGYSTKKNMNKHAFLADRSILLTKKISGILVESAGWDHWVKYKNGKCLQIGVMSCLINFCHVKLMLVSIGLVFGVKRDKEWVSSPCLESNCWDGSALHGYKCTSDICLRTCRGHSSHSSEVSVCRGLGPHPWVTSADFLTLIYLWNPSYLS